MHTKYKIGQNVLIYSHLREGLINAEILNIAPSTVTNSSKIICKLKADHHDTIFNRYTEQIVDPIELGQTMNELVQL